MQFGIWLCDQHPANDDMERRLDDLVEQVHLARDAGFSTIVLGQHFLSSPFQMLQTVPLLARLAPEAGNLRLATVILLLGLLNPVQVAEEMATLDVITHGRLRVGVGLGYRDVEFDAFGIARDERVSRFVSNLRVLKQLLAGEAVTLDSSVSKLENAALTLRPVQRPHPPIWVGANSDAAVRRAARLGDAWVLNPHARLDTLERQVREVYRPTLDELGKPFPAELPMRRELYVAQDRQTALREAAPWLFPKYQAYIAWGQDTALPEGDDFSGSFDELLGDRFILGSPEECLAEIERYERALGVTELLVRVQWPGMPQAQALENIERIGHSIIPHAGSTAAPSETRAGPG